MTISKYVRTFLTRLGPSNMRGTVVVRRPQRGGCAQGRQSDPSLRRSGAEMEVAGPRDAPKAYWSENKAPAAQLNCAGAVR